MKKNTRNILLLVAVIVVAVIFLKRRTEGFFGYRPARFPAGDSWCPRGLQAYVPADPYSRLKQWFKFDVYECRTPITFVRGTNPHSLSIEEKDAHKTARTSGSFCSASKKDGSMYNLSNTNGPTYTIECPGGSKGTAGNCLDDYRTYNSYVCT